MDFRRAKWVAWTGAVLALLLALIARRPAAHAPSGREGQLVPDFDLPAISANGLEDNHRDGPQRHRGQPLLLHFWAPSCGPCRAELPVWQALSRAPDGFTLMTVASDEPEDVAAYLGQQHLTLPAVWDGHGRAHRALGVWGIPHTFAISAGGVIVRDLTGPQDADSLAEALDAARAQASQP